MILLGQLTGVNAIMYYMSVLMSEIGFDNEKANYMSLVGGGSLLLGTIPAIFLMERYGRRFWAITMLPGFFIGLVLIGISYQFNLNTQLPLVEGLYLSGLVIYVRLLPFPCSFIKTNIPIDAIFRLLLDLNVGCPLRSLSYGAAVHGNDNIGCSPFPCLLRGDI